MHLRKVFLQADAPSKYNEAFLGRRKVDLVKEQVMEFLEDVTEARYFVEEFMKDLDTEETGIRGI